MSKQKKKSPTFEAVCAQMLRSFGYRATVQPTAGSDRQRGWVKMIQVEIPQGKTAYETIEACAEIVVEFSLAQKAIPLIKAI